MAADGIPVDGGLRQPAKDGKRREGRFIDDEPQRQAYGNGQPCLNAKEHRAQEGSHPDNPVQLVDLQTQPAPPLRPRT